MPDVDIIRDILKQTEIAFPESSFVKSLHQQYLNRGGLSKKQLEGLYQIALKSNKIPANKLSTLEAIILKKPTRYKSEKPEVKPIYQKDEATGSKITGILEKYPQHKRVLFLKTKYDNNEVLTSTELAEIEKFYKMLK
jgi:restriction endonuclease Mrr